MHARGLLCGMVLAALLAETVSHPYLKVDGNQVEFVDLQIDSPAVDSDGGFGSFRRELISGDEDENNDGVFNGNELMIVDRVFESEALGTAEGVEDVLKKLEKVDIPLGIPEEDSNVPGEPLTPEDFQQGDLLLVLVPPMDENSRDPIESAGLFQGDISGVNQTESLFHHEGRDDSVIQNENRDEFQIQNERNAIRNLYQRWPRGVIPYVISASYNQYERSVIAAAFNDYHENTCVRFVPRTTQSDYVHLLKGAGCSSNVGRSGGGQPVSLGPGCLYKGVVVHELMHAVGFWHEQSRTDRDEHININWRNIVPGMEFNFQKINGWVQQTLGLNYDSDSVMHYGRYAFARDYRMPTITSKKNPSTQFLGQRRGFSKLDLVKVNKLYQCRSSGGLVLPPVIKPSPVKPVAGCADNSRHCAYWSGIGECARNPAWMLLNCAKSCKQCATGCTDYNRLCSKWALRGECVRNPDYMTIYCAKSCQACTKGGNADTSECVNQNKFCVPWANRGQCQANPTYMLRHCRKSCSQC